MKTLHCSAQCAGSAGAATVPSGQCAGLGTCGPCPSKKDAQGRRELLHVNERVLHTGTLEAHSPLSWWAPC